MRCTECGKRIEYGEKIFADDEDTLCMSCLEGRIWLRNSTEEIAEALGYRITKYKRIKKPAVPE